MGWAPPVTPPVEVWRRWELRKGRETVTGADEVQARVRVTNLLPTAWSQVAEESLMAICMYSKGPNVKESIFLSKLLFKRSPTNIFPSNSPKSTKRRNPAPYHQQTRNGEENIRPWRFSTLPFLASAPAPAALTQFHLMLKFHSTTLLSHSSTVPSLVHPSFLWLTLLHSSSSQLSHHILQKVSANTQAEHPSSVLSNANPRAHPTSPQHFPYWGKIISY